jgi:hypothetical protein
MMSTTIINGLENMCIDDGGPVLKAGTMRRAQSFEVVIETPLAYDQSLKHKTSPIDAYELTPSYERMINVGSVPSIEMVNQLIASNAPCFVHIEKHPNRELSVPCGCYVCYPQAMVGPMMVDCAVHLSPSGCVQARMTLPRFGMRKMIDWNTMQPTAQKIAHLFA